MRQATVVLLINQEGEVCLARKKKAIHHEGAEISYSLDMWNGYGGKKEDIDESIEDAAIRELYDESGVKAKKENLIPMGNTMFVLVKDGKKDPFMDVYFYTLHVWENNPQETLEMGPATFFKKDKIPYDEMMPADKVIFERIFEGKNVTGEVLLLGKDKEPEINFKVV